MNDLNSFLAPHPSNTQDDHGETNVRLLAREIKADFRRVESASRKIRSTLQSPEGKRLFLRFFDAASLNMHFISVIAPINLPVGEVEAVVNKLEELVEKNTTMLNEALVHAEQLCHHNGIIDLATYDVEPLTIDVRVHSKFGRRYLELISKVDQLMQILETLVIDEVMSNGEMAARKARAKRAVRAIGSAIRLARFGLHKRINSLGRKPGEAVQNESPDGDILTHAHDAAIETIDHSNEASLVEGAVTLAPVGPDLPELAIEK